MINDNGEMIVIDENGNPIKINALFNFEVPEIKKKYIAYVIEKEEETELEDVFISEIDCDTNKIRSIPIEDMKYVSEMYNKVKEELLNS